ncbi:MAG: glycosyltransferase family 4 protein [Terrimicrobiaceae bacterium]|nr:glycosyltransferase family 4 protein [Terrimicrobiaceae bacterium]
MTTDRRQPRALLYSIAAGIGGAGLDQVAAESLLAAERGGFLARAIAFANHQSAIPSARIELLDRHPARLLSFLPREYYIGAKKHALDRRTARRLASGRPRCDLLHTWSGDCIESLRAANRLGIPSVLEIPTWHRNKGKIKKDKTWSEIQRDAAPFPRSVLNRLLVTRQQIMEEYARATLLLVLSEKARETFLVAGIPEEKLFLTSRGVDVEKFTPAPAPPEKFRAIFVGSLSRRKGVHHLLAVWKQLNLADAELVLVGQPTREIAPLLADAPRGVIVRGFVRDVAAELRQASVHILPSECEGSAKATYEAAACGLPQITTREAGDVVRDGENGLLIPPNDPDALATAIKRLHLDRDLAARLGAAGRERVAAQFTWDHFRERLLDAYDRALRMKG